MWATVEITSHVVKAKGDLASTKVEESHENRTNGQGP